MKKVLTSLVGVMSVIAVANAEPYVGINLIYDNIQLDKSLGNSMSEILSYDFNSKDLFANNYFGASIDAGYQFNDYFGVEAYFQYNFESSVDISVYDIKIWDSKSNFISGGLDIMGYLPLNENHSFSLIGTIGGGYYRFETKTEVDMLPFFEASETQHENNLALRMGAGFQYNFNESMSIRALGRYIAWKHDDSYTMNGIIDQVLDNNTLPDVIPVNGMWEGSIGFQYKF